MNKAFIREPDDTGERHCPRCGSLGVSVGPETLQTHLGAATLRNLAEAAFFCPFPRCEVVYFDVFERVALVDAVSQPVYPKDADAPICGCFGLTREDIEQDLREGGARRVRELLAKSKTAAAQCTIKSVSGHCCAPEAQRIYMSLRAAQQERA